MRHTEGTAPAARVVRLDALTSLRSFAALAVFGRHLLVRAEHPAWLDHVLGQGSTGVSLFFLLSGFLLTTATSERNGPRPFYRRRFARIYPAYLVAGIVCTVAAVALAQTAWPPPQAVPAALLLVQAWIPEREIYWGVLDVAWSLSAEIYLMFPLVIGRLRALELRARRLLLAALVAGVFALGALLGDRSDLGFWFVYIFPPTRFAEFVVGILLALEVAAGTWPRLDWRAAVVFAAAGYLAASWAPVGIGLVAVTLVPFVVLIGAVAQADASGDLERSWLRRRPLIVLGIWSYGFYLVHATVLEIGRGQGWSLVVMLIICLPVAIGAAGLLYSWVERPAEQRLARRASPSRLAATPD